MSDLFEQRQYEESATTGDASARAEVEAGRVDLHTSCPGIVESFDKINQTAVVRPAIKRYFRGEGFKALPALMDVPVQFPRGGRFVLTFPVTKGDECILFFSERAIDTWFESGGVQAPHEFRTHDLSDAYAAVGISSKPNVVSNFSGDGVELRSLDGETKFRIGDDKNITVETSSGDVAITSGAGDVAVTSGTGDISANTLGKVVLNVPGGASAAMQMSTGVLVAADPCPILGVTHGALGGGCARVHAGKL